MYVCDKKLGKTFRVYFFGCYGNLPAPPYTHKTYVLYISVFSVGDIRMKTVLTYQGLTVTPDVCLFLCEKNTFIDFLHVSAADVGGSWIREPREILPYKNIETRNQSQFGI